MTVRTPDNPLHKTLRTVTAPTHTAIARWRAVSNMACLPMTGYAI